MIKTTGAVWKAFHRDDAYWGGYVVEDEIINVNDEEVDPCDLDPETLKDDDVVKVKDGYVYEEAESSAKTWPLVTFFNKWKRSQTTETLTFAVPKAKVAAVKAAVKAALASKA
jgi:hypothetical protein